MRLVAKLACDAHHAIHRSRIVRAAWKSLARLAVVNEQCAQRPFPQLSRHATTELRVRNLAREKEINRRGEKPRVLDEEGALLREKNRKALIDCHLRVVGFHLTEIRIQRDVKREGILHHEFGVEPREVLKSVQEHRWCAGTRLIQKMIPGKKPVRNELNIAARRHVFNPANRRELL